MGLCFCDNCYAEALPQAWFTGMNSLSTFICRNCKFAMAADARMLAWHALRWLDISYNPLNSDGVSGPSGTVLPAVWEQLNITTLKVLAETPPHAFQTYPCQHQSK